MQKVHESAADRPRFREGEEGGQGGGHVGEGLPAAQVFGPAAVGHEQWYLFARVIGAAEGRIVAVVGGEDHQVLRGPSWQEAPQPAVERDERARVAFYVPAMAVE